MWRSPSTIKPPPPPRENHDFIIAQTNAFRKLSMTDVESDVILVNVPETRRLEDTRERLKRLTRECVR